MFGFFRTIGEKIGEKIEEFGDWIGSETISNIGCRIQDACSEKVASENSYDKSEANIYTTERLNTILVSFTSGYFKFATQVEKNCIRLVEDYYDKLIDIIENVPSDVHSKANLRALKSDKRRIAKTITGGIKDPLAKRMSLDDTECLKILKMDSGRKKGQAMSDFTNKVIKESLDNLSKSVRISLNDQTEDIKDYLNGIVEEQEREMKVLKEKFDKIVMDGDLEQGDKEKNCVQSLFVIDAAECVSEVLG